MINEITVNDAGEVTSVSIDETLAQRGSRYGPFKRHAEISQELQRVVAHYGGYRKMSDSQCEAINMIMHKIGRVINGDPNYDDNWRDIAGYAQLIVDELNGKET